MVCIFEAKIVRKLDWALLPIASLMVACCMLDRSNVAYMQLQLRRPPPVGLSFSPSLYGNAAGLFFLSYSFFQIPSTQIVVRGYRTSGTPLRPAAMHALPAISAHSCTIEEGEWSDAWRGVSTSQFPWPNLAAALCLGHAARLLPRVHRKMQVNKVSPRYRGSQPYLHAGHTR